MTSPSETAVASTPRPAIVPPADPAALADAMRRVAAEPELARRLGAAGRQVYEERASEDVLGPRWRALIEELL